MAISHAFSNAISDGTNTNIVRPSDWNSAHNQYYTLSGNTLGASTVSGTNVVFQGSGNVSLSGTGSTIVVYGTGGGGGGIALGASSQTATSGTVNFVNSNGISFGMSGSSQITASHNGITSQSVQTQASGNIAGTGFSSTTTAGTAITAALGTNGLTMAIPAYLTAAVGGGGVAIGASSQTATSGTVNFVNSNGITFGMSGSNQITASHNGITTQTVQTQASGNIAGTGFTTAATAGSVITGALGTNGLNLGVPAYLTTQSVQTQASGAIAGTNTSANNASITLNSNGLTISVAPPGGGGVMYANLSGNTSGNTTASGSTLNFSGINITLSGANNSQIAISAPATSSLVAGANITISTAGSTISIIGGAGGGGVALGASTQTATSGTVVFANSNGISFGMAGSNQITASHNGITTQTVQTQAAGNIAGTGFSSTTTAGTAITAALGTNGLTMAIPAYLTAAAGAGNAIGVTGGGSTGVAAAGTVYFGTANQLTFGFDPVSTRVTAAWGLIVTAGTTNANPVRQLSFSDVNGISFGLSTGAGAGHTITASVATSLTNVNISAGTTSNNLSNFVFSNSNGVSFGLNGSTVTASVAAAGGVIQSGYSPHGDYPLVTGLIGQGTLALDPDIFPDLTLNMVAMPINFSFATNSTGSFTISNWLGLYSRNVSSISLAHSTSFTAAITFSGIANSASYNGWRNITYNWSTSVSGGRYWIANIMRTTTGGANCSFSQYLASQINTNFSGAFGVASNATAQLTLGQGFYSASTTALPGSIAFTQINGSNSLAQRFPMVAFGYNTV